MKPDILSDACAYVCGCKQDRIETILPKMQYLGVPRWSIAKEEPDLHQDNLALWGPSRRFREQIIVDPERPLMWLEDDADIPANFSETWQTYSETLPADWKVAVIGWGGLSKQHDQWEPVEDHWCRVVGGFWGSHCVIVNSGDWRLELAKKTFVIDSELLTAMKGIGIDDGIYFSRRILVGTCDPYTTNGGFSVIHKTGSKPRWWGGEWSEIEEM